MSATFLQLFKESCHRYPLNTAVEDGSMSLSYRDLDALSDRLGACLVSTVECLSEETVIGLSVRGIWTAVAVLGIWKAGFAFGALDSAWPRVRLLSSLSLVNADFIVCMASDTVSASLVHPSRVLILDEPAGWPYITETAVMACHVRMASLSPASLAYVIFTSGSTGVPKAVLVPHLGLPLLVRAQSQLFDAHNTPTCRFLQFYPPVFDAFLSELCVALGGTQGGTAVWDTRVCSASVTPDVLSLLAELRITHACLPPALVAAVPASRDTVPLTLRSVIVGGEVTPGPAAQQWARHLRLVNAYGPTEATVCATGCIVAEDTLPPVIGRPFAHVRAYVLSEPDLERVPDGEVGFLYLSGDCLARGYAKDPVATAAVFVPDPFCDTPGERMYRTGDRAFCNEHGQLVFVGRSDMQVQVRGYRVEIGEVEAAAARAAGVGAVAVVAVPRSGTVELVCAFEPLTGCAADSVVEASVWQCLRKNLPRHAWPRLVLPFTTLPKLSASGKVDRMALLAQVQQRLQQLQSLQQADDHTAATAADESTALSTLLHCLGSVLPTVPSLHQPLQKLGLSSLDVLRVCMKLRAAGLECAPQLLLGSLSPAALAEQLCDSVEQPKQHITSVFPLLDTQSDGGPPVFPTLPARAKQPVSRETTSLPVEAAEGESAAAAAAVATASETHATVFVTGATGWLGRHVVCDLLRLLPDHMHILCLVRATSNEDGMQRLLSVIQSAESNDAASETRASLQRLSVVCGDINQPRFGLSLDGWDQLVNSVKAVVHCAGAVSMLQPYSALRTANVVSTAWAARLAADAFCPLHHVSSLSVFVSSSLSRPLTLSPTLTTAAVPAVHSAYALSKWAAERETELAASACPSVHVYRPAMLSVSSRSGRCADDYLVQLVALFLRARCVAHLPGATDVTAVDWASAVIACGVVSSLSPTPVAASVGASRADTSAADRQSERGHYQAVHIANVSGAPLSSQDIAAALQLPLVPLSTFASRLGSLVDALPQSLQALAAALVRCADDEVASTTTAASAVAAAAAAADNTTTTISTALERVLMPAAGVDFCATRSAAAGSVMFSAEAHATPAALFERVVLRAKELL